MPRRNLTQFSGYPGRSIQRAASRQFPEHTTVIRQYYFRFERNNAMNDENEQEAQHGSCSFLDSKFKAFLRLFKASQGEI
jgi:hypothetical protein